MRRWLGDGFGKLKDKNSTKNMEKKTFVQTKHFTNVGEQHKKHTQHQQQTKSNSSSNLLWSIQIIPLSCHVPFGTHNFLSLIFKAFSFFFLTEKQLALVQISNKHTHTLFSFTSPCCPLCSLFTLFLAFPPLLFFSQFFLFFSHHLEQ